MRRTVLAILLVGLLVGVLAYAEPEVVQLPGPVREHERREILIPDILGMKTMKCDFHVHTVFSDGDVWPTTRVQEAWQQGLDAIAITDHIEYQPNKKNVKGDHNASYEIALPEAEKYGLIIVRGAEITRDRPEGHWNALFLKDANPLDKRDFMKAAEAAVKQGAFLQWNHPGGESAWTSVQDEMLKKGWMNGIEVLNGSEYYVSSLKWCMAKNLAVMANTDTHEPISESYDTLNGHRPMTLVFAKERSESALREAMLAGRTAAWFGDFMAGKKELLEPLFQASIPVRAVGSSAEDKRRIFEISNNSDLPYVVQSAEAGWDEPLRFSPRAIKRVALKGDLKSVDLEVTNLHTSPAEFLVTRVSLPGTP